MKLLWLTDIHLDQTDPRTREAFFHTLRAAHCDAVLLTGDISTSHFLARDLGELAQACAPRKVYFVLGNHDFYGSSFDHVDRIASSCCQKHTNLHHLGQGEIIRLGPDTALIGHRGWADGRAYGGKRAASCFPDQCGISDLRFRSPYPAFRRMNRLGRESGAYFRKILPYALSCYSKVIIGTHVPLFASAVRFNGKPCDATKLPHYVNATAGALVQRVGERFPRKIITVLCGHAHHGNTVKIGNNLEVRLGEARRGRPSIQGVLEF